jgi:hypothetical protein
LKPSLLYTNDIRTFLHSQATSAGSITTVQGFEPKVEADVVFGGDRLYFDPDKQRARVNVKAVAKFVPLTKHL